jgi:sulfate adenylyltransferase
MNKETGVLLLPPGEAQALRRRIPELPGWDLGRRGLCDLELLMQGAFAPLNGYMSREQYESVLAGMRLPDGRLWPLPICLALPEAVGGALEIGGDLALNDREGFPLAVLRVEELWRPDRRAEALALFGTDDPSGHAGVRRFFEEPCDYYVSGPLQGLHLPMHHDSLDLRRSPDELRTSFRRMGWSRVLGTHPHGLLHRMDREVLLGAARRADANILLMPAADQPFLVDDDHFHKVRCHRAFYRNLPEGMAQLGLLPLASRGAGPREAMLQALALKSCGCTHFLVDASQGEPQPCNGTHVYPSRAAFELLERHADELGIEPVLAESLRYHSRRRCFMPAAQVRPEESVAPPTPEELDTLLEFGRDIPSWYVFPDVLEEMRRAHPPRHCQGFSVFFTGLSGAGKSTLAKILYVRFMEEGSRPVTLLDGDIVRRNLSSELGFSREHRVLNVTRIGFVASEIVKNRGIAICAPIAPYEEARRANRELISQYGGYVEIHVSTSLEVCERRDRKGLYAKARAGLKKGVTGVDDPFEPPQHADLSLDTSGLSPEEAARKVFLLLEQMGYVR